MKKLPYIDEYSQQVEAPVDAAWRALLAVLVRQSSGGAFFARILRCDPAQGSASWAGQAGQALPGFIVAHAEPGRRLELRGKHRFAQYTLTFTFSTNQLVAQTHAAFPGVLGWFYRVTVISSGGHRLVTRRLLRSVARTARRFSNAEPRGADITPRQ